MIIYKTHISNWFLLLVFFLLYSTDSAMVNTNSERIFTRISWVIMIILFIRYFGKPHYKTVDIIFLGSFVFSYLFSMIINEGGFGINYIQRIVILILAFSISREMPYDVFMDTFVYIMKFIAVFSTVSVLLAPLIRELPFPEMHCGTNTFKNLLFTNVAMHSPRNYGPFWEPGAFQLYLNWAILYLIRNPLKFNFIDIVIFAIAIISTRSTSGIILLALNVVYFFINTNNSSSFSLKYINWIKTGLVILSLASVFFIVNNAEYSEKMFSKITSFQENSTTKNSENVSAYTRFYSIYANLEAIQKHPVSGAGIYGIKDEILDSYDLTSDTNSVLAMPATFGIIPGILYIYLLLASSFKKGKKLSLSLLTFLMLLIIFGTENLMVSLPFWIFLFYESNENRYQNNKVI